MNTDTVKGFRDYIGKDSEKFSVIREIIRQTFEKYNFEETQTPIIEQEEFVKGENSTDEAVSDIFRLSDKGERKLALRYELTFQLKRLAQNRKLPYKRFQIGSVFRDEPVKGNRFRQFTQCDIDIVGSKTPDEAEILRIAKEIFDALKIKCTIYFNNRKLLNEILDSLKVVDKVQAIREIDKIDKLPEKEVRANLERIGAEKLLDIVKKPRAYFEKYENYKEILELEKYCNMYGVKIVFAPYLARGLGYYTGTIFEVKGELKETITAGGAYMVNGNPSIGISFGLDRLCMVTKMIIDIERYLVVSLDQDKKTIELTKKLREAGKNASAYFGKPSKALEYANSYGIKKVVFVGADEVAKKVVKIKDMKTGKQINISITKILKKTK